MQASWDIAAALIGVDGLADLLGERHRIIANDWQAAYLNTLMSHLLDRAADILEQIDFTPRPCAPTSPTGKSHLGGCIRRPS